jgi:hypothetical protein
MKRIFLKIKLLFFLIFILIVFNLKVFHSLFQSNEKEKFGKKKINLVCWIPCLEKDLDTILEIKKGWGKHCTHFLLSADFENSTLNSINVTKHMNLGRKEVYKDLALKVWHSWKLVFEKYKDLKDFFFMKADPDSYIIMENYLELLSKFDPFKKNYFFFAFYFIFFFFFDYFCLIYFHIYFLFFILY